jgi:peptidoglycan/xylan/chitin deacetylase (PgdA/CDA1 family)
VKVLTMLLLWYFTLMGTVYAEPGEIIDNVAITGKAVAISVEDIRTAAELESVVAIGEMEQIKMTFFLSGQFIEKNAVLVKKTSDKGYEFGNYGLTMKYWGQLRDDEIAKELTGAGEILQNTLGVSAKFVRPPYNYYENDFLKAAYANFLSVIRGLDTSDWTINSPQAIIDKIKNSAASGDIISINMKAKHSAAALPEVIRELKGMGFEIVTVSQLLAKVPPKAVKSPKAIHPFAVISRVSEASPKVALTFDDGGSSYRVDTILDVLRANEVHSTFFLSGDWAENNPNLVRKIAEEGHEIANHSYSHPVFSWLGADAIAAELISTETALKKGIGDAPARYFRPPYGDYNNYVIEEVRNLGYEAIVLWDVDTRDWSGLSSETIINRVISQVTGGSIVLFHLHAPGTPDALSQIIPLLKDRGYVLTTVGAILESV